MFAGLSFAAKARRLWKRLKRLIRREKGVPVDVIIATYLLKREAKSIALAAEKVVERHGDSLTGATPEEKLTQAHSIAATSLARYLQHKI